MALIQEALWEAWKERAPLRRKGIDEWGRELLGCHRETSALPLERPLSPALICPALVYQPIFCFFIFLQFIKIGRTSSCFALALGVCPRGKYNLLGDQEEGPSAAWLPPGASFF